MEYHPLVGAVVTFGIGTALAVIERRRHPYGRPTRRRLGGRPPRSNRSHPSERQTGYPTMRTRPPTFIGNPYGWGSPEAGPVAGFRRAIEGAATADEMHARAWEWAREDFESAEQAFLEGRLAHMA